MNSSQGRLNQVHALVASDSPDEDRRGIRHQLEALVARAQSFFDTLLSSDIAGDLRGPDDPVGRVLDRRDTERDIEESTVLVLSDGFVMLNALAAS